MRITTRSNDRSMPISTALREHILRRLGFALGPVADRVRSVSVSVGDENGPRGGADKYCSIRAEVDGRDAVFVRDRHADLYAAISLAAARAGRAALRAVRRGHRVDRHRGELPALANHVDLNGGVS
jgi:ribosome-associated translation inhibitor RaiA